MFRDPDYWEILEFDRQRDDKDNTETEPAPDELIDLRCIWTIEFYTPSHIERLLAGFSALGWDKDNDNLPGGNPARWVRQLRENAQGGGWFNLGSIDRPENKRFFGINRRAPLPEGVEFAIGALYSLTSSINCIVMGFVLAKERSQSFETVLRQTYQTYLEPRGRGYRIHRPSDQKRSNIQAIRREFRGSTANWFRTHLPGLFSSGILDGEFPTCELVTLRKGRPFAKTEEGGAKSERYMSLLDLEHDFHAWEAGKTRELKFAWPMLHDRESKFHSIAAANENDIDRKGLQSYGGGDQSSYVFYLDNRIRGLLSRWALLAVLSGFERQLGTMRDSATFWLDGAQKPLKLLSTLRKFVSQGIDISPVSSELNHFAKTPGLFTYDVESFAACNPQYYQDKNITLDAALGKSIGERAAWLSNVDRFVRDLVIQYGTAVAAHENLRLQITVRRLTWVATVLTALSAIILLRDSMSWLRSIMNNFTGF